MAWLRFEEDKKICQHPSHSAKKKPQQKVDYSTLLLFYSFTLLLFYSFTLLLFYSFTLLLFYSFTLLLFYSFTLLLFYSFTLLLFYSFTLLLFYSFTLLLFYSFILQDWFEFYLRERTQVTIVGQNTSNKTNITCGVPQGSVLGPLLFLLYVNDICSSSKTLKFYLFADDTNILLSNKNLKSLEKNMNIELNKVYQWLISNKLTLNFKKSNFVIFRPYQKRLPFIPKICIKDPVRNTSVYLECKEYVKYLGVLIDYKLSWKNHIGSVALKISKTIGLLSKLRHFCPHSYTHHVFTILLLPRICAIGLLHGDKQAKPN